jgi:dienelactone hydrolase
MVTMRRRTLLVGLAGIGAPAACASPTRPAAVGAASPSVSASPAASTPAPASSVPILASTADSSLAPRDVTAPYTPTPGRAPAAYAVGRRVLRLRRGADRPLPTTVWYPAVGAVPGTADALDGAAPAAGRFPLVLFSHGLTAQPDDYADVLARWARAGFVVAGPTYPRTSYGVADFDPRDIVNQPADASFVIDSMLGLAGPLGAIVDPDRLAAGGHSAGGITTVGLFSAYRDERLKAGVVLNGTDFQGAPFVGPPAAMLFVHGRRDGTVTHRAGHAVYAAVPWSRAMLSITEGGHVTKPRDFEATVGTSTEFLRWALYGDAAARARIPTAAAAGEVGTLEDLL